MIALPAVLLTLLWIGASWRLPGGAPPWMYPAVLAVHGLLALLALAAGWRDLTSRGRDVRVVMWLLCAVPPLAPVLLSHLFGGVARRAARRRGVDDPLGLDLAVLARRWFVASNLGVVLLVLWGWRALDTLDEPVRGVAFHLWLDPLSQFRPRLSPPAYLILAGLALWFGRLLGLTLKSLLADRRFRSAGRAE